MPTVTARITSKQKLSENQKENYHASVATILDELAFLIGKSRPMESITVSGSGVTVTIKVDMLKSTK
jgi:hypothetical protein